MTIGESTKKARENAGITIGKLAEKAGYHYNTVWWMENDIVTPKISTVIDLADALGISVDEYVGHEVKSNA